MKPETENCCKPIYAPYLAKHIPATSKRSLNLRCLLKTETN